MSMSIRQIRQYIPQQGQRSPFRGTAPNLTDPVSIVVPVVEMRAVEASNLQIHPYAYSTTAILKIRGTQVISYSGNTTLLSTFEFDSNLTPYNITTTPYDTNGTSGQTAFIQALAVLASGTKYFAILVAGTQTFTSAIVSALQGADDLYAQTRSGSFNYVAVGYAGKIIDSMWNGNDIGGVSQLFVNGKNIAKNIPVYVSTNVAGGGSYLLSPNYVTDGQFSTVTSNSSLKYFQVTFPNPVNVDYISLLNNNGIDNYAIIRHKITVVTEANNEVVVQPPTSAMLSTKYGSRYFLFDQLTSDSIITGGIESSLSNSELHASINRLKSAPAVAKFTQARDIRRFDDKYYEGSQSNMLGKITDFANIYPLQQTTNNYGRIEAVDIGSVIKNIERIKTGIAACNSGCAYICFDDCNVVCIQTCGINCGTSTCTATCSENCGFQTCKGVCGNVCADGCYAACAGGCAALCAGGDCGSACKGTCSGGCTGSCASSCSGSSCGASCSGSCGGSYIAPIICTPCSMSCGYGCDRNCTGTCGSACTGYTCGNTCYATCGSACTLKCGVACGAYCGAACANNVCGNTCSATCTLQCQVICGTACGAGCTNTCELTCISSSGTPYI